MSFIEGDTQDQQLESVKRAMRTDNTVKTMMNVSAGSLKPEEQLAGIKSATANAKKSRFLGGMDTNLQRVQEGVKEFVETTMIRGVVLDLVGPMEKARAKAEDELRAQRALIRDHSNLIKNMSHDFKHLQNQLGEFVEIRKSIS